MTKKIKKESDLLPGNELDKEKVRQGNKNSSGFADEEEALNEESDVSKEEASLLARSADSQAGEEDEAWREATLDNVDEEGEPLNEENEFSGKDLDVPGSEEDDDNEETGGEDEENNSYSIGGEKKD